MIQALCPIQTQLHLCTSLLLIWELVANTLKFLGTVSPVGGERVLPET